MFMITKIGAPGTQSKQPNKIFIDGEKYEILNATLMGAELKEIAGIQENSDLFMINQDTQDILIRNDETINLSRPGVEHFATRIKMKEFKIIVNGRENNWAQPSISFEQLIELAFGVYGDAPHIACTSTYDKGPIENRSGVIVKGQHVFVTNNMIFNATRTDKS